MKILKLRNWQDNLYMFSYRGNYTDSAEYFHAHEGLEILYIHEGTGTCLVGGQTYFLQPGTLILIKPYQQHHVRMNVPPVYIRSLLKLRTSVIEPLTTLFPYATSFFIQFVEQQTTKQVFHFTGQHAAFMELQLLQLGELLTRGPVPLRREGVLLFLLHLFTHFQTHMDLPKTGKRSAIATFSRTAEHINAMLKWIDQNYKMPFTIAYMASRLHFSPNYLSKLFKEQMGKTIIEYTNEKRLEQAKTLLEFQTHSVEEISKETGFKYPSYFIQLFKKKVGVTPQRYRDQVRNVQRTNAVNFESVTKNE
ncbi:AraC family transcriptional regulator [Paenibacillus sp. H1-7]|uniref:AraC family transcriptional regulator n=1 Tax=Paenibacillus sp. H1-7 TaxID=2282849 RepID=UPI001EF91E15|nr:AraC family transcriptional regulator [Paenibacillus sp. H1-7]ULL13954.1 AraC family transcriptional regulator [Paenibacillus sp. H1-7]